MVLGVSTGAGWAADLAVKAPPAPVAAPTPEWDLAFGGAVGTDYNFRGITQSDHRPYVGVYSELRYNPTWLPNVQLYYGSGGESIDFPNHAAAEVDFYGGFRPTFGALALDFGNWYYYYPGGQGFGNEAGAVAAALPNGNVVKSKLSFDEWYAKATYTFNDYVALTGDVFYDPNWLNSGAYGTYASGILKLTAPSSWTPTGIGASISGELGHYWFGTSDAFYGVPLFPAGVKYPEYTHWNVGLDFTWKVFTLDLRYYDTDLTKANCNILTSDHTASFNAASVTSTNPGGLASNWCGASFIAKLSADLTVNTNLK